MNSSDDPFKKIKGLLDDYERADERALWELRRQNSISDDNADGWRNLALILARQLFSGFPYHREPARRALIKALRKTAKGAKSRTGRPRKRGPKARALILRWVEWWKANHPPTGTRRKRLDKEAIAALREEFPEVCEGQSNHTVATWLSTARRERKEAARERKEAALVNALKRVPQK